MLTSSFLGNEILSVLLFVAFVYFVVGIILNKRKSDALDLMRADLVGYQKKAEDSLARAKQIATMAAIEQPFAVCESCGMIRSCYVQDEDGITCIECAEKHTDRN